MLPSLFCLDPFRATLPQPVPLPGHLLAHRTSPPCSQPVPWPPLLNTDMPGNAAKELARLAAKRACLLTMSPRSSHAVSQNHLPSGRTFFTCIAHVQTGFPGAFWTTAGSVSVPLPCCALAAPRWGLCREDGSALGPAAGCWGGQCCDSPSVPACPGGGGAHVAL